MDTEVGLPPIILVEQEKEQAIGSKEDSQEDSSTTLMDSELEMKLEEGRTKKIFEKGEARNTPKMEEDQVSRILVTINIGTSEIQA